MGYSDFEARDTANVSKMLANWAGGANSNIITEKFTLGQQYASSAWSRVLSYLDQLSNIVVNPQFPDISTLLKIEDISTAIDIPPGSQRPEPPDYDNLTIVDPGMPVMGDLLPMPQFYLPTSDVNSMKDEFVTRVREYLVKGTTGLDASVEQMLWDRAISRQELQEQKMYDEADRFFSSRGFNLPTGAMAGKLNEISIEIARNRGYLNNDITIEQARLAQTNMQFVLGTAVKNVLDMETAYAQSVFNYNRNVIEIFTAEVEAYKFRLQSQIMKIEALVKVYVAKVEAYKADVQASTMYVQSQVEIIKAKIEVERTKADLYFKEAELEIEKAKYQFGLQVEAIKAGASVAAQIAASALASVSATAAIGFSGSASIQAGTHFSESWNQTQSDDTYSNIEQNTTTKSG